jgi:hypothetical protein
VTAWSSSTTRIFFRAVMGADVNRKPSRLQMVAIVGLVADQYPTIDGRWKS